MYDELLIFNMKNLDKETFADGLIRIACYDANSIPFAGEGALLCTALLYCIYCTIFFCIMCCTLCCYDVLY